MSGKLVPSRVKFEKIRGLHIYSMQPFDYTKAIEVLTTYAYSEGFEKVYLDSPDISIVTWKKKTLNSPRYIKIQNGYSEEYRTYFFLHELGHHELRKDWDKFHRVLPVIAEAEEYLHATENSKMVRRVSYKVAGLEEEYMAWDEALLLAKRFKIPIDIENFYWMKTRCLLSYIKFYSK